VNTSEPPRHGFEFGWTQVPAWLPSPQRFTAGSHHLITQVSRHRLIQVPSDGKTMNDPAAPST
jgi:hypothetical protein